MPYDPERHGRRSIRAKKYDYAGDGMYFITICTAGREMLFGNIRNGAMAMNEMGWIAWEEWEKSAEIRREIELDSFVVMPNHLHGLVTIVPDDSVGAHGMRPVSQTPVLQSQTSHSANPGACHAPLRRAPRSLGSFVAGFKGATTRLINEARGTPGTPVWQRNYYERIVRNERMMERIWTYIECNPLQWSLDRENPDRERDDAFEAWIFGDPRANNDRP
jgi:putative transposase